MTYQWQCSYDKTYNGKCEQQVSFGLEVCYYHNKVQDGLIEVDEQAVIRTLPTII